jgi:hypothetical protein
MDDEEIVAGYVKHVNHVPMLPPPSSPEELEQSLADMRAATDDDPYFWAWEVVTDLVETDPERAWRILLQALALCSEEHEYIIGAGPLEDLLVREPRRFAKRVAERLHSDGRFQAAFAVIIFSTEYCTAQDAEFFNGTLREAGVTAEAIPEWRIADPDWAV